MGGGVLGDDGRAERPVGETGRRGNGTGFATFDDEARLLLGR